MSNDKIINNINDAVQEVRSSLTPYEIRYLKNKNVQKYNNNLLNWIYLSSSSSHSSLYSAQNVLKEQFNINNQYDNMNWLSLILYHIQEKYLQRYRVGIGWLLLIVEIGNL